MKILKRIGVGIVAVVVAFAVFVTTRPAHFRVERTATVNASPESVQAQVTSFHAWAAWSPWEKLDPGMKRTFGGAPAGVGATYAWAGNDEVGEGKMAITDVAPGRVVLRLEFLKPFAATHTTTFTFRPAAAGTEVTWAMEGRNAFMGKVFALLMNVDRMIGADFEKGLGAMKAVAERAKAP